MKFLKNWAVHNLLGHPLKQLLTWLGLEELGNKVHDMTMPDHSDEC